MRKLVLVTFFLLSLSGIANAQKEKHASLPQGREVDRQVKDGPVEGAKARAEAADRKSAEAQVEAARAGAAADRANKSGHGIGAAMAEKNAERAAGAAEKAKSEAREAQKDYDRERSRRDRP
jgi:hypothetical protein